MGDELRESIAFFMCNLAKFMNRNFMNDFTKKHLLSGVIIELFLTSANDKVFNQGVKILRILSDKHPVDTKEMLLQHEEVAIAYTDSNSVFQLMRLRLEDNLRKDLTELDSLESITDFLVDSASLYRSLL